MSDGKLKSAPLAYENESFLNSPDGRVLRILSEYTEPLSRFRREQIQDTVVFFGSARFHSRSDADQQSHRTRKGTRRAIRRNGKKRWLRWTWRTITRTRASWLSC